MMFRQVVRGLRYLHEWARLVHRDIKLENVLVDEMGLCKITDFGTAKPISPNFYQRSSPVSVAVSRSQSRSVSRSRPCEELSEPDLEKLGRRISAFLAWHAKHSLFNVFLNVNIRRQTCFSIIQHTSCIVTHIPTPESPKPFPPEPHNLIHSQSQSFPHPPAFLFLPHHRLRCKFQKPQQHQTQI